MTAKVEVNKGDGNTITIVYNISDLLNTIPDIEELNCFYKLKYGLSPKDAFGQMLKTTIMDTFGYAKQDEETFQQIKKFTEVFADQFKEELMSINKEQ